MFSRGCIDVFCTTGHFPVAPVRNIVQESLKTRREDNLEPVEILLRLTVEDSEIHEVRSTVSGNGADAPSGLEGRRADSLFSGWPLQQKFSLTEFLGRDLPVICAARVDNTSSILVYYLDGVPDTLSNPAIPFVRLVPDRPLPIVSPGFVSLLGYTPWELAQSELIPSLLENRTGAQGTVTLIDKAGAGHRLVYSRSPIRTGGTDLLFIRQPDEMVFPVADLERLASMDVQGPEDILAFLVDVLDLEAALILVRSLQGYVPAAQYNIDIDEEFLESSALLEAENLHFPIWVDLGDDDAPAGFSGQCLIYPSGELLLVTPWRGDADGLQRRVDSLMPAVSMRYDQFRATHGEYRIKTLLSELDRMLTAMDASKTEDFIDVLDTAARGFSASVLAVFGPEEASSLVATSRIDPEGASLLVSDRPFEECFPDTHVTVLKEGFTLLAAWDGTREIPYATVDSFGGMLKKINLSQLAGREEVTPDLSVLQAVLMENTRVLWQGRGLGLSYCYQFYGHARQCTDCPVAHLSASGTRGARLENHQGYIEEIHPAGKGFLVNWTKLPEGELSGIGPSNVTNTIFPGGTAKYAASGEILSWTGWLQETTGVGSEQAVGQNAGRLLNKLGNSSVMAQFKAALSGNLISEPVEFVWKGIRCFSRMRTSGEDGAILHTVLDSTRAGLPGGVSPLGPGTMNISKETGSLAEYLSTACRREGWDFDISGSTSEDGAPVWFSRTASTDLLSMLLHQLAPMCPDRWTGLETGWLDNTPETGGFSFLPGRYHVLRFSVQGMRLPTQSLILERLRMLMRGFGGWLAGLPGEDVVQIGIPAARDRIREIDVLLYSPIHDFTDLCCEVLSESSSLKFVSTSSAAEMAVSQQTASSLICRLDHSTLHYATALAVRIAEQPILAASGLSTGIPFGTARIEYLRLPVDRDDLRAAVRRIVRE